MFLLGSSNPILSNAKFFPNLESEKKQQKKTTKKRFIKAKIEH